MNIHSNFDLMQRMIVDDNKKITFATMITISIYSWPIIVHHSPKIYDCYSKLPTKWSLISMVLTL